MWASIIVSTVIVTIGAALWLMGSAMVAFPDCIASADLPKLFHHFLGNPWHPGSLIALLLIDIAISLIILRDEDVKWGLTSGNRFLILLLAGLGFFVFAFFLPGFNGGLAASHAGYIGAAAYLCVGIIRALTYAVPQGVRELP